MRLKGESNLVIGLLISSKLNIERSKHGWALGKWVIRQVDS